MERLIFTVLGCVISAVVFFGVYQERIATLSVNIAEAQGKVSVMQHFCGTELEKTGIIQKEKKNDK